jgi:hypothetical protein
MRPTLLLAVSLCAAGAAGASAKPVADPPAAGPEITVPRAYEGYSEPEIGDCRAPTPLMRECTVPAMTAGRYLIEAAANATATGANATQTLQIKLGGGDCISTNPAAFTGKAGLHLGCEVTFLTDRPIVVSAVYAVQNGTADPKGPQMAFHRLPWNGIVQARGLAFKNKATPEKK